jgi:hypothetical protein
MIADAERRSEMLEQLFELEALGDRGRVWAAMPAHPTVDGIAGGR